MKKAHELSVLCKVDVALVIRVKDNKYYEYGSKDVDDILKNYSKVSKTTEQIRSDPRQAGGRFAELAAVLLVGWSKEYCTVTVLPPCVRIDILCYF